MNYFTTSISYSRYTYLLDDGLHKRSPGRVEQLPVRQSVPDLTFYERYVSVVGLEGLLHLITLNL